MKAPDDTVLVGAGLVGAGEESNIVVIKVKVTKLEASLITAGTPAKMTLSDNGEYWYVFTAPEYGRYTFNTVVTDNETGDSHSVDVGRYDKVCGTLMESAVNYKEMVLKAGDEVVLKVTADEVTTDKENPVTTSASITVAKVNFEAITNNEASLDIVKGVKWYSFTAPKDGTYTFKKEVTAGTVAICIEDSISGLFTEDDFAGRQHGILQGRTDQ